MLSAFCAASICNFSRNFFAIFFDALFAASAASEVPAVAAAEPAVTAADVAVFPADAAVFPADEAVFPTVSAAFPPERDAFADTVANFSVLPTAFSSFTPALLILVTPLLRFTVDKCFPAFFSPPAYPAEVPPYLCPFLDADLLYAARNPVLP